MDTEAILSAALREAGYGPDAIGSALPRILRILEAEDVRIEMGRPLSRKEREYVRLQLELGLGVSEIVAAMTKCAAARPADGEPYEACRRSAPSACPCRR